MFFNIFVRLKCETHHNFCHWPVMRERRSKELYIGNLTDLYPTNFTKRTLGAAMARLFKQFGGQVVQVEVRQEPDYDGRANDEANRREENEGSGGGAGGSPGYSEACGVYN